MAFIYGYLIFAAVIIFKTDCQPAGFLGGSNNPYNPSAGSILYSMASQLPAMSQKAATGSNFPAPQAPQVLTNALRMASQPGAAQASSPFGRMAGMFGGAGNRVAAGNRAAAIPPSPPNRPPLPVTPATNLMVSKMATQLGYKAYYEAHGCLDPTTTLMGTQARMASIALMMGCNNFQADEVCNMAQMAHSGGQGSNMRTMVDMMIGKDTKHLLEECLTPSTLMNGVGSMMGSKQLGASMAPGYGAPPAAASQSKKVDCSSVTQMLMMSTATEGLLNPEALEQIGTIRNRYFKMTCQENMILGGLPYRLCCPGHVKPPTMQEAMMMRGMTAM